MSANKDFETIIEEAEEVDVIGQDPSLPAVKTKTEALSAIKPSSNQITVTDNKHIDGLSPLVQVMMNKDFDPERLAKMLDIQKDYEANEARKAFFSAMAACQKEMPSIAKTAVNQQTSSKYAKHEAICNRIKPVYTENGFALSFHEGDAKKEDDIRILCDVDHEQGFTKQYHIDLPKDMVGIQGKANKTDIHSRGSTFTYGRRYLTLLIFDLATYDDNDANTRPPIDKINENQLLDLNAKITEVGANKERFLKAFKIEKLSDLPEVDFNLAIAKLDAKAKMEAKK